MNRFLSTAKRCGAVMLLGFWAAAFSGPAGETESCKTGRGPKTKLSEYGFFAGNLSDLKPATGVFTYDVNAPLFSDYAEKARFIYLPEGTQMAWNDSTAFQFPDGAAIIKNFYYPNDASKPDAGRRILETRLLIKEPKGWKALEYIWNVEQTDAMLEVTGASFPFSWRNAGGKVQQIQYVAPNINQCKGCHSYDGQFVPIGINARQLNRENSDDNQLLMWNKQGRLSLPPGFKPETGPRLSDYRQFSGPLVDRARAYLDSNCGHCHNPRGPAGSSGMFLDISQNNPERLGVGKAPVAAGRGSGNRKFGIVPGEPGESILLFRMENNDPGIRMPELGRQLAHHEGIELIKSWIKEMK
ncbi:MAG: hypothetical protein IPJ82_15920 [Lewinellaceae bacterium]|nr:hypothetical protein [Lewinellaceae bacterium]